ncbi:MAG: RNA 2',3'-cyclic phosphodiesterase [Desulfuromonadaceae bacterium]|nr:RNA 2',3'-cyclic phosphodiesterase [Desulfuromonadaceae bacterium]
MRLFIAIELPEETKRMLLELKRDIHSVRWLAPEQLHLTLLFLGEVEEGKLEQLCMALSEIRVEPFTLEIAKSGCFPGSRAPKVLWVGLESQPALNLLALNVTDAVSSTGIELEKRRFTPHITLARVKQPGSCDISCYLNPEIHAKIRPVNVTEFVLFQSLLTQQGAIHQPIRRFPLPASGKGPLSTLAAGSKSPPGS